MRKERRERKVEGGVIDEGRKGEKGRREGRDSVCLISSSP